MDYIVIGLLIVLTSLVSAVLYACCVMSGKIDKLAEQRKLLMKMIGYLNYYLASHL